MKNMKKQILITWMVIVLMLLSVAGLAAQDRKVMKMKLAEMEKSPSHTLMMAYRYNLLTFAKPLREMAKGSKLDDVEMARKAFAELKRSMEKMEEVHLLQMSKMTAEMTEIMYPTMEKMQAENMSIKENIIELEKALKPSGPNAKDVYKYAAAIVSQFEKMDKTGKKMAMAGKQQR